jgi:hypothetical protein
VHAPVLQKKKKWKGIFRAVLLTVLFYRGRSWCTLTSASAGGSATRPVGVYTAREACKRRKRPDGLRRFRNIHFPAHNSQLRQARASFPGSTAHPLSGRLKGRCSRREPRARAQSASARTHGRAQARNGADACFPCTCRSPLLTCLPELQMAPRKLETACSNRPFPLP